MTNSFVYQNAGRLIVDSLKPTVQFSNLRRAFSSQLAIYERFVLVCRKKK